MPYACRALDESTWPAFAALVETGVTLVTNLRGGADAVARAMKTRRPSGIDCSRSFVATTGYARVFGGFAIIVGGLFVYQALASW